MTWQPQEHSWAPGGALGGWCLDIETKVGPVRILLERVRHASVAACWRILVSGVVVFEAELPLSIDEDAAKEHALKLLNGVVSEVSATAVKEMLEMMSNKRKTEKEKKHGKPEDPEHTH